MMGQQGTTWIIALKQTSSNFVKIINHFLTSNTHSNRGEVSAVAHKKLLQTPNYTSLHPTTA